MDNNSQAQSSEFYAKHKKVYPREVHGLFATLRNTGVLTLLGLYYFVPWFRWDGHQAVLFDLPARKFYIFNLTFWPQDFIYLAALLIIAALALFFFTALAGRLWCGYACPQTVWTEVFLWMERWFEGDRNKQIKLDKSPWAFNKVWRKSAKHTLWLLFSIWTGFTFVGYFTPILELGESVFKFTLGPWETFWILFYGFATYGNAGWLREQVCIYMCPYARFQSAMIDKDTLIISYVDSRGEPRGSRKRSADPAQLGLGDCVDCTLCVQVCPTGIDIRDGMQYQCIGCAACVDVCNEVMDKMGYNKGLVKYTTQHAIEGIKTKIARPRMVIYAILLTLITSALIYNMVTRMPLELDIIRDRNALYRETNTGLIENTYILKLINMDKKDHSYHLKASGIDNMKLIIDTESIIIKAGTSIDLLARIQVDPVELKKVGYDIHFDLQARDNPALHVVEKGRFIGPLRRR
ncbi:MAG: cytochrome c oxidase accessory protein CcoG [Gammaproteobacteria bacterium]|nr:cytochrome c oxidase accessory protein CcoG [Gammaproteobacteria bacterium]